MECRAHRKFRIDFVNVSATVAAEDHMDDDTADLVRQLCTRAGMIMEDASTIAILVGGKSPSELRYIVDELEIQSGRVVSIVAATSALIR